MPLGQVLLRGGAASSGINYLSDALDTRKIREDALRRMAQGTVSPYARRSDPSGLCSVPDPFAGGVGYPAVRGYRYEGHPAAGTAGKGGFNLADFGKELLTGFVAGGLSSAAFYGAGKAVEAVKGSARGVGKDCIGDFDSEMNEALRKLESSGLRLGQTEISRGKVKFIVDNYNPVKAQSSIYRFNREIFGRGPSYYGC